MKIVFANPHEDWYKDVFVREDNAKNTRLSKRYEEVLKNES